MSCPPVPLHLQLTLSTPEQTARLARAIGAICSAGDCLLLDGPIGAGKTHFARALIQGRLTELGLIEDVPSPTFTLVQTYEAGPLEIWHADLYRLTNVDEVFELGLDDAFETALCLIEWPDRLGDLAPKGALHLRFATMEAADTRCLDLTAGPDWARRLTPVLKEFSDDRG